MNKIYKKFSLILGVIFLFFSSISFVNAETLVRCKILLPKLLNDSFIPKLLKDSSKETQTTNLVVKWYDLIYKIDDKNKKITEDGNDKFEIRNWEETRIFAINKKPKKFDFAKVAAFSRIDIEKKEVLNAIEFDRINGKLYYAFFVKIESDLEVKLCKKDGRKYCNKGDFWRIARYATLDGFGCEKINKKF